MASAAEVLLVSLLAAVAPVFLFVLLRKGQGKGAEKAGWAPLAALREMRWPKGLSSASSTATPLHPMLTRVAPSEHGFLPARVPDFSFDSTILDGFVQIADAVPEQYAKEDTLAFRSWLEGRLLELFPKERGEKGSSGDGGDDGGDRSASPPRRFAALDAALRSLDGERQRSLLVPLVFLAHAHRWGSTSPPQWVLDEGAGRKKTKKKNDENEKEGKATWQLPEELARPLDAVRASVGGIQRSGSVSLLFLRNWRLVSSEEGGEEGEEEGEGQERRRRRLPLPGEPFSLADLSQRSLRPRFRFCSREMNNACSKEGDDLEAAEASVLHSVVLTEAAASRLPPALLALFDAAEEAELAENEEARERAKAAGASGLSSSSPLRDATRRADAAALAAAEAAAEVSAALRAALSVFHDVFKTSKISTRAWSRHIQPFFCALTPSRTPSIEGEESEEGEEEEEEEEEEHGVGGAQIPWVHVTDALFGIAADDALGTLIARNRPCLLPEERLFVSFVEAHSLKVRRWLSRGFGNGNGSGSGGGPLSPPAPAPPPRSEQARLHWNRALSTLVAWRATHRARAAAYLVPAGGGGDAPRRSTTGGTAGYGGKGGKGRRRSESSSGGDENAAPTPASVLSPAARPPSSSSSSFSQSDGEEEEREIRASFNRLMDGRIARTRASSIDGGGGRVGGGGGGSGRNLSDLFPLAE